MKTYDGIHVGDLLSAGGRKGDWREEMRKKKLVNMTTTEYPEMAAKLKPCPFCGEGFRFFREVKEYDNGDRLTGQYYLHDGRYNSGDYCPMIMMGMNTLGAGDADPEAGRIGELAEMWNRRFTGCVDREGRKLFTGDIVVYEDAENDVEGYNDNVYEHPGMVDVDELGGIVFTQRMTVNMDNLLYELPNVMDCRKIGNVRNNPEYLDMESD